MARFVRDRYEPELPPPPFRRGMLGWLLENLFSSWWNAALTALALWLLYVSVPPFLDFMLFKAVWEGSDRSACLGADKGACWAFIRAKLDLFIYGRYPAEERWRPDLVFLLAALALVPLMIPSVGGKFWNTLFLILVYPVLAFVLLNGGMFGLEPVETALWGGLLVTLVVSVTGLALAFPLGVLLALGRQSKLPIVKGVSIAFIEFWRGVPLVTVLFMASIMLPLFLPDGVTFDKLLRAIVGVALFEAAYIAEVVRGGLQAIPAGQYEAAKSIGLGYWGSRRLIILPQALRLVIPGIVNTIIALFKDTSLVLVIGLFDLLGILQAALVDPHWSTPNTALTGYLFVAAIYLVFCLAMSRYSLFMERNLSGAERVAPNRRWNL